MTVTIKVTREQAIKRAKECMGWHYIYGYKYNDNPVTKAVIQRLAAENSQVFTDSYYDKAVKFIGENAIDCSGLVCRALGIGDYGSYQFKEFHDNGTMQDVPWEELQPGDILWKQGHVGIVWQTSASNPFPINTIEAWTINYPVGMRTYQNHTVWKCAMRPPYVDTKSQGRTPGWKVDGNRWWYSTGDENGDYYRNGFYEINGKEYFFDKEGYLCVPLNIKYEITGEIISYDKMYIKP